LSRNVFSMRFPHGVVGVSQSLKLRAGTRVRLPHLQIRFSFAEQPVSLLWMNTDEEETR
jgi:hypothetical protein